MHWRRRLLIRAPAGAETNEKTFNVRAASSHPYEEDVNKWKVFPFSLQLLFIFPTTTTTTTTVGWRRWLQFVSRSVVSPENPPRSGWVRFLLRFFFLGKRICWLFEAEKLLFAKCSKMWCRKLIICNIVFDYLQIHFFNSWVDQNPPQIIPQLSNKLTLTRVATVAGPNRVVATLTDPDVTWTRVNQTRCDD